MASSPSAFDLAASPAKNQDPPGEPGRHYRPAAAIRSPFRKIFRRVRLTHQLMTGSDTCFQSLGVGQKTLYDFPENIPKIITTQLWNDLEPGTMRGKSNE
jgi:hypothetical protein